MNDLAIPLSGVDALHAHFAEWVKFLDAKGLELEAQLARLEAKKAKAGWADTTALSSPNLAPDRSGFLELAFGAQANQTKVDPSLPATNAEPTVTPPVETDGEAVEPKEPVDDASREISAVPGAADLPAATEAPAFDRSPIPDIPPDESELV
jgi:hypothetical protein